MEIKKRCHWCNLKNPLYVKYHDEEWGIISQDVHYLYEMLMLEMFQAGLSWECVLNKREAFRKAFDNFQINKIINYDEKKIFELSNNHAIIRNKLKIQAVIHNSKIYQNIVNEYGSFYQYLLTFTKGQIYYVRGLTTSALSDLISNDLRKKKMKFVGSVIVYAYLQAIGIINSHEENCFLFNKYIL